MGGWTGRDQQSKWNPETHQHMRGQLILDRGEKTIQWRKDSLFSNSCWNYWKSKMNLRPDCHHIKQINSMLNIVLNIKTKTIKLLEENKGEKVYDD